MIYSISGKLTHKKAQFVVVESNGLGYKVFISNNIEKKLPAIGSQIQFLCSYHVRQEMPEIYGFLTEKELEIFELLNTINGVGPKSALSILNNIDIDKLMAAISQNRVDLISENWKIGRKKAERIILELKDKIKKSGLFVDLELTDSDKDVRSALKNLGYKKFEIDEALNNISSDYKKPEDRLKFALKFLHK